MEAYWKVLGAVLTTLILGLHIGKQEKDLAAALTLSVCCLGTAAVVSFLEPVLELLRELEAVAQIQSGLFSTLLKCTGIAIVSEAAMLICQDAGNGSLGKLVQLTGSAVILYLSIPAIKALLGLLQEILGVL